VERIKNDMRVDWYPSIYWILAKGTSWTYKKTFNICLKQGNDN
jgi:hypothetical protein